MYAKPRSRTLNHIGEGKIATMKIPPAKKTIPMIIANNMRCDRAIMAVSIAPINVPKACATKGIKIEQYHADDGRFADPAWKEDCRLKNQKLTFCGVGAHHQNAIVE